MWTFSLDDIEAINSCIVEVTLGMGPVLRLLYLSRLEVTVGFMDMIGRWRDAVCDRIVGR